MQKIGMVVAGLLSTIMVGAGLTYELTPRSSLAKVVGDKESAGAIKAGDKSFVLTAAAGGLAEVELGQLARERGDSEAVKKLSQHMVDDHTRLNNELSQLASKKGVALPAEPMAKHKAIKEALAKLSGPTFDKQYVREMVKDHEADIAAFQKEADQGKDSDLVTWVKQSLPTLQAHLAMAKDAEAKVNKAPPGVVDKAQAR